MRQNPTRGKPVAGPIRWLALGLATLMSLPAAAQTTTVGIFPSQETGNRIKKAREISPYGPTVMGDSFGTYAGALSFSHVDAAIPGNDGLSVSVGRSFSADAGRMPLEYSERFTDNWHAYQGLFGDWEIDLPYLGGTYSQQQGWVVQTANATARCSTPTSTGEMYPPAIVVGQANFRSHAIHSGVTLNLPGGGSEALTLRLPDSTYPKPIDAAYRWQTESNWSLSCLGSLQSSTKYDGTGSRGGEGFLALSPDGTKYRFDWMVEYAEKQVKQINWTQPTGAHGTYVAVEDKLPRVEARIYPTRVEDRFGNWVNYTWSGKRLTAITASDGRSISLTYNAQNRVATVTAAGVTTTYGYDGNGSLTSVTRADGSQWTFNFGALWTHHRFRPHQFTVEHIANYEEYYLCAAGRLLNPNAVTLSMTSPSGASGSFQLQFQRHYRDVAADSCFNSGHASNWMDWNNVPGNPTVEEIPTHLWSSGSPMQLELLMLTSKTLTGSNLPANQTWSFAYHTLTDAQYELTNVRRKVTVTKPDGNVEESIFGASHQSMLWETPYPVGTPVQQPNEGKLLSHRVLQSGVELSKTENTYVPLSTQLLSPPSAYGSVYDPRGGACVCDTMPVRQPLQQQRITQQGATFTRTIDTYDEYARPVDVTRSSVIAGVTKSRTDKTEYHDNKTHWVIGQVARTSTTALGGTTQIARTEFNALAQPVKFRGMGDVLVQEVAYHGNGSPNTVKDGKGNTTTLTDWYRGIPRSVAFADATTQSALVHDAGWITRVTDQNGAATNYGYDSMGRLASITYPTGGTAWNQTTLSFAKTTQAEVGFPIGTWRQQVQTGNGIKRVYFDAMWRPRVSHEYDSGNLAGTSRYSAWTYDHEGRTTFSAYPLATAGSLASFTQGVRTYYDALGRVTSTTQNSEIGTLTSLTEYLAGFKVRTTNPRGKSTTTSFLAWDQPDTSMPRLIEAPAGVTTTITRDAIGRSTQVSRAGTWAGAAISANRYYRYNPQGQLERSLSSEERATYFDYDAAGNVLHTYHCNSTSDATCGWTSAGGRPADRTSMTYDTMNRVTLVDYPSGTDDVATTYHDDGAVATVVSGTVTREFVYNNRAMLTDERVMWGTTNWLTSYGYNANGHQATLTYRDGHQVSFAPNALGQATQAGTYATNASYFPNGALKQFTYGNGIVHTLTQNARQLPERSQDALGATKYLDDTYDYDQNGNVAGISDALSGQPGNRDMAYDDLDRLVGVTAGAAQGGNAVFAYDVLDNIRQLDQGTRTVRHTYDTANRLDTVTNAAGTLLSDYAFDTRGNLTQRITGAVTDTFTFDKANRLKASTINGVVSSYLYDGLGRRVRHTEGAVSSYFVYGQAGQLLFSQDGVNRYNHVHLSGSLVAKRLVPFDGSATKIRYQHTDALGSPVLETSETAALLPRERMTAYGEPADGTWSSGPGFTGHQMDAGAKLVYMQQRYYDPVVGRFLSADPVATDGGTGAMFNRYSYGNNNPYRFTDPDGRVVRDEVRERHDEERRRFRRDHERYALEEGSPSNVAKRNAINDAAEASEGSTDWARDKEKPPIGADLDKCNLYPYDIANSVGATFPMKDTPSGPRLYRAAEIADPSVKIKNWRVLGPNETPQGGDIGAYATPAYRITSGHAGVIVRRSGRTGGITTMSTSDDSIVEDDDHIDSNPAATFRRYEGD